MKILIYNPLASDQDWVVGSFRTEEVCSELSKHGVKGVIASPRLSASRRLSDSFIAEPLPRHPVQRLRELLRMAINGGFDVIQERPMPGDIGSNGYGCLVSLKTGIPFVLELHNLGKRRRFLKHMHFLPLCYWRATTVLEYAALGTVIPFSVNTEKIVHVHNGYSQSLVDEIRGREREVYDLRAVVGERIAFGYFGEISSDKGVELLLEVSDIVRGNPGIVFVLAGKGNLDEFVKRKSVKGKSNVVHLGLLTRKETFACMSQCRATIALHPQWQARIGNPVKVIESIALGVPAIVSSDYDIPAPLRSCCVLADSRDASAAAKTILEIARTENALVVPADICSFSIENIVRRTLMPAYRNAVGV